MFPQQLEGSSLHATAEFFAPFIADVAENYLQFPMHRRMPDRAFKTQDFPSIPKALNLFFLQTYFLLSQPWMLALQVLVALIFFPVFSFTSWAAERRAPSLLMS